MGIIAKGRAQQFRVYDKGTWQGCLAMVYDKDACMSNKHECTWQGTCQGGIAMVHD